jgi:hypothetical protein
MPKNAVTFTRYETTSPTARARSYVGRTNSVTFFGGAVDTVLLVELSFQQEATNRFLASYTFAEDPINKWKQTARYRLIDGSYPKLSATQVAGSNGVKEVTVQGTANFNDLNFVTL